MNETIIIIDAFLNKKYRIDIFEQALKQIKKIELPILLISNSTVSENIQKEIDYFIYDKSNLLFSYEYENIPMSNYYFYTNDIIFENYSHHIQKYALSVIANLNKACDFALKLGYKKFVRFEWDFIINEKDLGNIKKVINDYLLSDKKGYFLITDKKGNDRIEFPYHFWMVDLDFWKEKYPNIYTEEDYQRFLFSKYGYKKFEIAERINYLAFNEYFDKIEIVDEKDFIKNVCPNSKIDAITSDENFIPPSDSEVVRGLARIFSKNKFTGRLGIATWNRAKNEDVSSNYTISFKDQIKIYNHFTSKNLFTYNDVEDFDYDKFPITLKIDDFFEKTYYSPSEINNLMIYKNHEHI